MNHFQLAGKATFVGIRRGVSCLWLLTGRTCLVPPGKHPLGPLASWRGGGQSQRIFTPSAAPNTELWV